MGIRGLDAFKRQVAKFKSGYEDAVKGAISDAVSLMVADAKARAPRDLGKLIASIDKEDADNGWTVIFFVGEAHGAFQEFGFGKYLDVPPELEAEARKFQGYKSGNFEDFLENIKEWCERKGIDPRAAWPIAVSILRNGLKPQPYFYPAYERYKDTIVPDIENRIKKLW